MQAQAWHLSAKIVAKSGLRSVHFLNKINFLSLQINAFITFILFLDFEMIKIISKSFVFSTILAKLTAFSQYECHLLIITLLSFDIKEDSPLKFNIHSGNSIHILL